MNSPEMVHASTTIFLTRNGALFSRAQSNGSTGLITCIFSGLDVSARWGTFRLCGHLGSPHPVDARGV